MVLRVVKYEDSPIKIQKRCFLYRRMCTQLHQNLRLKRAQLPNFLVIQAMSGTWSPRGTVAQRMTAAACLAPTPTATIKSVYAQIEAAAVHFGFDQANYMFRRVMRLTHYLHSHMLPASRVVAIETGLAALEVQFKPEPNMVPPRTLAGRLQQLLWKAAWDETLVHIDFLGSTAVANLVATIAANRTAGKATCGTSLLLESGARIAMLVSLAQRCPPLWRVHRRASGACPPPCPPLRQT